MPEMDKTYLGDGAYASFDGFGLWLTAENGLEIMDRVYLEPSVYRALLAFAERFPNFRQTVETQK